MTCRLKPVVQAETEVRYRMAWLCPVCTLYKREPYELNATPFPLKPSSKQNQGEEHLNGKKHKKRLQEVGTELFSRESMTTFFGFVGGAMPDMDQKSPEEAFKEYTRSCGADPDQVMPLVKADPPPPPPPPTPADRLVWQRSGKPVNVCREIISDVFAIDKDSGRRFTRILCCWDDPVVGTECKRPACPFLHASTFDSTFPSDRNFRDLFAVVPCCFAGMHNRNTTHYECKWHGSRYRDTRWYVPKFLLDGEIKPEGDRVRPSHGVEVVPFLDRGAWRFHRGSSRMQGPRTKKPKEPPGSCDGDSEALATVRTADSSSAAGGACEERRRLQNIGQRLQNKLKDEDGSNSRMQGPGTKKVKEPPGSCHGDSEALATVRAADSGSAADGVCEERRRLQNVRQRLQNELEEEERIIAEHEQLAERKRCEIATIDEDLLCQERITESWTRWKTWEEDDAESD